MGTALIAALEEALEARRRAGLLRVRRTVDAAPGPRIVVDGRAMLAFASNDYLGLAVDPAVVAASREGALRWGAGAGASHLLGGHLAPHSRVEDALAEFVQPCDGARGLLFSTGYHANLAIVTALAGRGDAVFLDRLDHACLYDGAFLSRAEVVRYPHGDVAALAGRLAASAAARKLIATDAVFSMDGDLAPLPGLLELARAHDAWLVVDDAHGFGVLGEGRGSLAHFGLRDERIVYMGTLGKAAGVAGAFVAAHPAVVETLVQTGRSYIYTTAQPAMLACALDASLAAIRDGHARRARLARNVLRFRAGAASLPWSLLTSTTPIQPLMLGASDAAVALSEALWERGIYVPAIRPPTVPPGTARLRVSFSAAHSDNDVDELLAALREAAR
jgi:8-amino-7-oxononanoate synthase